MYDQNMNDFINQRNDPMVEIRDSLNGSKNLIVGGVAIGFFLLCVMLFLCCSKAPTKPQKRFKSEYDDEQADIEVPKRQNGVSNRNGKSESMRKVGQQGATKSE